MLAHNSTLVEQFPVNGHLHQRLRNSQVKYAKTTQNGLTHSFHRLSRLVVNYALKPTTVKSMKLSNQQVSKNTSAGIASKSPHLESRSKQT